MSVDCRRGVSRRIMLRDVARYAGSAVLLGLAVWFGLRRRSASRRTALGECGFDCAGCSEARRCAVAGTGFRRQHRM